MHDDRPLTQRHPIYSDEDDALRQQIIRFCREEIEPYGEAWEEAGTFRREQNSLDRRRQH